MPTGGSKRRILERYNCSSILCLVMSVWRRIKELDAKEERRRSKAASSAAADGREEVVLDEGELNPGGLANRKIELDSIESVCLVLLILPSQRSHLTSSSS
eukprot:766754-Hanusia_phi.AAC.3